MSDEPKPADASQRQRRRATPHRRSTAARRRPARPRHAAATTPRPPAPAAPRAAPHAAAHRGRAAPPAAPLPISPARRRPLASAGGAAAEGGGAREAGGGRRDARSRRHLAAAHAPRLDGPRLGRVLRRVGGGAGRHRPVHVPQRPQRAAAAVQGRASRPSTGWAWTSAGRRNSASGSSARRTTSSQQASGFYALLVTCTHLGCTPNYLSAESKFKCPCHGSGFRADRHQLRRARRRGRSSARASCWPTTGRSSSTRRGSSSTSSGSGRIRRRF